MSIETVSIFLTPTKADPNEAEVKVFPDEVTLFINATVDDDGKIISIDIDDVIWQYVTVPPQKAIDAGMPAFPASPQPADVQVEVRLAPLNTPFGPSSGSSPSPTDSLLNTDITAEGPIDGDTAAYVSNGINPLVPNKPRLDAAPPPSEEELNATSDASGPARDYKYAVVLTTAMQVYTLDPKLIIIRRHRRARDV